MIKIIFHILNIIFIFLYIYPGSLLGFLIYKDISKQPQISRFFSFFKPCLCFFFIIFIGFNKIFQKFKKIILYLIFISIILELLHLFIPNRSFQFSDLFGNIIGVLISILILILFNFWRKK